jgi:hypothetical protein
MKKHIIFPLFICFVTIISCSKDYDIEKSIFHEDALNPGLPIYSEWGYNTFGAFIDRIPFVSNNDMPSKIIVLNDTLIISMKGIYNGYNPAEIKFSFIGYSPRKYEDLTLLDKKEWDLANDDCIVILNLGNGQDTLKNIMDVDSKFCITSAQNLYIDKELNKTILSGTFQFQARTGKYSAITINKGRFDLAFGYDNFYYF